MQNLGLPGIPPSQQQQAPNDFATTSSLDFDLLLGGAEGQQSAAAGGGLPPGDISFFPFFGGTQPGVGEGQPLELADSSGSLGRRLDALQSGESHDDGRARPAKRSKVSAEKSKQAQKKYREKKKAEVEDMRRHIGELSASLQEVSAEKSKLEQRCGLLEKALHMRSAAPPEQAAGTESVPEHVPEHVLALRAFKKQIESGGGAMLGPGETDFTRLNPAEMFTMWRAYVKRLTQLLLEGGAEEGTAASTELNLLIQAQRRATMAMGRHDARRFVATAAFIRARGAAPGAAPEQEAHLRRVLAAAKLSHEQKEVLVETRAALLSQVRLVLDERRTILKALQEALPGPAADGQLQGSFRPFNFGALILATDRLQENHRADCRAALTFVSRVKEVLRPEQEAQLVVASYPQLPNFLALQNLICVEFGLQPVEPAETPTASLLAFSHPELTAPPQQASPRPAAASPADLLAGAAVAAVPALKQEPLAQPATAAGAA